MHIGRDAKSISGKLINVEESGLDDGCYHDTDDCDQNHDGEDYDYDGYNQIRCVEGS